MSDCQLVATSKHSRLFYSIRCCFVFGVFVWQVKFTHNHLLLKLWILLLHCTFLQKFKLNSKSFQISKKFFFIKKNIPWKRIIFSNNIGYIKKILKTLAEWNMYDLVQELGRHMKSIYSCVVHYYIKSLHPATQG